MKTTISIDTATMITDMSRRTLWRRIKSGLLATGTTDERGRTMLELDTVREMLALPITDEDLELLATADRGDLDAQNEAALMFLELEKPEAAMHWLTLAASSGYADAMHLLSKLYFTGEGVKQDDNLGMHWLAQAAANGHTIARAQMAATLPGK